MIAVEFPYQDDIAAKDHAEYLPLPYMSLRDERGSLVFCFEANQRERFAKAGKIYVSLMTFGNPIQPIMVTPNIDDFISLIP
jgi:hypothetical protein